MFKHFWLILLVISIGGLFYFGYPIIKNRYFDNAGKTIKIQSPQNSSSDTAEENNNIPRSSDLKKSLSGEGLEGETAPAPGININEKTVPSDETLTRITTEHCNNDCATFAMDLKFLEYCQQVCGIAPAKNVSGCDDKNDLEKDYCQKDLAITKKDSKLCDSIKDANIKLTCQNRIIEDLLENQQTSPPLTPGY